ncbi:MAG: hypothetical protein AB8G15_06815 [Saprospiraceae bacterium]
MEVFLKRKQCLSQAEIMGYLKETCKEEKLYEIETHLLDCELCSSAVEGYASMHSQEDPPILQNWGGETQNLSPANSTLNKRTPRFGFNQVAAALVLLLISVGGFAYWNHLAADRLYHRYEKVFDFAQEGFSFRGVATTDRKYAAIRAAIESFNAEAYEACLREMKVLLAEQPENAVASFYGGMSALKLAKTSEAIHYLSICRINSARYYEDASWYLALSHLQRGDKKEAKIILEELQGIENGYYEKEVVRLLTELSTNTN